MTCEQIEKIIYEAQELGIFFIGILGGEPLLRKDLFPLLSKHKKVAFRISTNGTLLDSDIIQSLKEAGNIVLFFSLEGFQEETDFWRGKGIYRQILKNMRILNREKILFGFSVLLHAENKNVVISEEFLNIMQKSGNKFGLYFPYGPIGEHQFHDLVIGRKELKRIFNKLSAIEKNYSMLIIKEGFHTSRMPKSYFLNQGCGAGVSVHITPQGFVEPCNAIHFYTENIFEKSLLQILKSSFYRDIHSCAQQNEKDCVGLYEPFKVIDIIAKNKALESHKNAFDGYYRFARIRSDREVPPSNHFLNGEIRDADIQ
jgi:MoaA/NifB/PqqE/SkfB family radical SAM enzyme